MTGARELRPEPPDETASASETAPPRHAVADLLKGGREAILVHGNAEYRLRVTANGKLILTK